MIDKKNAFISFVLVNIVFLLFQLFILLFRTENGIAMVGSRILKTNTQSPSKDRPDGPEVGIGTCRNIPYAYEKNIYDQIYKKASFEGRPAPCQVPKSFFSFFRSIHI
jgi:hypothetical protein